MELSPDRRTRRDRRLALAFALSLLIHLGIAAIARGFVVKRPVAPDLVEVDLSHFPRPGLSLPAPAAEPAKPALVAPVPDPRPVRMQPKPRTMPTPRPTPVTTPDPKPDFVKDDVKPQPPTDPAPADHAESAAVENAPARETAYASGPTGGIAGHPDLFNAYQQKVARQIERARKFYPYRSRLQQNREEGIVAVRFVILPGGGVQQVRVVKSSGHPLLDQAAVEIIENAAPFPPLPPELGVSELAVNSPIRFTLRSP